MGHCAASPLQEMTMSDKFQSSDGNLTFGMNLFGLIYFKDYTISSTNLVEVAR
jgi:hypothetical protein